MMLPQDSLVLAVTKFKTRRIRLFIAVAVSGLLFIAFAFVSFVARGSIASVERFSEEGFAGRYIVQPQPAGSEDFAVMNDKALITQAKELDKKLIEDKKQEAKRLDITYDPAAESLAVVSSKGPSGAQEEVLNVSAPHIQSLLHQARVASSKKYIDAIAGTKESFSVKGTYSGVSLSNSGGPPTAGLADVPSITIIKDDKERVDQQANGYVQQGIDSIISGWVMLDDSLLEPFLLEGQKTAGNADGVIPLVAPYSAVEEMLHLTKLPDTAKADAKLARLKEVRSKAAGITFSVCLRNQSSMERVQTAITQQQELANSTNNKDYIKPELLYDRPARPCEDVVVARDVRTYESKTLMTKQEQFEQKFGKRLPSQRKVTFKIVGVVADPPQFGSFSVEALIGQLLTSNLGTGWFTPSSSMPLLPEYAEYVKSQKEVFGYTSQRYIELADAATTKRYVKAATCNPTSFITNVGPGLPKECEESKQYFFVQSFGSNSVALDDVRNGFSKFFVRALLVASVFSALILMGTVGRVMADGRRETAVFRAIGAKRLDIAQIYITYVLMIGASIAVFSIGLGYVLANVFDARYSSGLTVKALLAFNAADTSRQFHMRSFSYQDIGWMVAIILVGSLLSALIPLLMNLKRNPIADMRDER